MASGWCSVLSVRGYSGIGGVVRGGFWLYGSSIVNNFSGFLYWMVLSSLAGSEVLGLTSATVGLATLFAGILGFGVDTGLRRFLGKCLGAGDSVCLSKYLWSTLFFALGIYFVAGAGFLLAGASGIGFWSYSPEMLMLASVFIFMSVSLVFSAFIVSILRTDVVFLATVIGNVLKFVVGIGLVLLGFGWIGAVIGYMFVGLAHLVLYLIYVLRTIGFNPLLQFSAVQDVLRAGIVSWLPSIIVLSGQWLSVLFVFGSRGAIETGHYYVAYTISMFVLGISMSMLGLLLPVLSGMGDGRKRAASRVLRVSLLFMMPITVFAAVYPYVPLGLLGSEYIGASNTLRILLVSSVPLAVTACINSLVYAYGFYRMVLVIGLAQNIPRMLLYMLLVPRYSGLGAALSFTIGSCIGLFTSVYYAGVVGFKLDKRSIVIVVAVPSIIGLSSLVMGLEWFIGMLLIGCSYPIYLRLRIISRSDLRDIAFAIMSREYVVKIYDRLRPFIDIFLP